jgi:hypothetical protein
MLTPVAKRSRGPSRRQFRRSKSTPQGLNMAPDGGRERLLLPAINMALLAEGKKCKLQPLRNSHVRKLQVPLIITLVRMRFVSMNLPER